MTPKCKIYGKIKFYSQGPISQNFKSQLCKVCSLRTTHCEIKLKRKINLSEGAATFSTTTIRIMTVSMKSLRIETFSIRTFSIMTFSIRTLSIKTLRIMTFSIKKLNIETLSRMTFS
jgi:hypothetical protein